MQSPDATRRARLLAAFMVSVAGLLTAFLVLYGHQSGRSLRGASGGTTRYLLYLPAGYRVAPTRKWPVILFLHGSTERGTDVNLVRRFGLPAALDGNGGFPFLVISPQCGPDGYWDSIALKRFLDRLLPRLRVDPDRIYLTGISMGGFGAWYMAVTYPDLFAAVAPVSAGGDPSWAYRLKGVPFWVFHGALDRNIPPQESRDIVDALRAVGGSVKFTLYPDLAHDCWTPTYANPELYKWFLKQKRKQRKK